VNSSGERSRITLDAGAICRGLLRVEKFGAGAIRIRSKAYVGDDCLLSSSVGIDIGEQVLIAHGVQIFDNDSHPLESSARAGDFAAVLTHGARGVIAAAPVRIERRAWIGFHAIILKGVTVGENSVIAAGSVVTQDIPANSVAAGNPARVIKSLLPADV
jgi:acetyltransferase-like isoleucine patch superfamily enzyme